MRIINSAAILLLLAISSSFAVDGSETGDNARKKYFYQWVDNSGEVHINDDLGKVPEQYREQARKIENAKIDQASPSVQQAPEKFQPSAGADAKADEAARSEWKGRLGDWKDRLLEAKTQYRDLDREYKELLGRWGSLALAPGQDRLKAQQIEQRMKEVQKEIDEARNMIEVVIPEEARKAGVPPGWLRE